MSKPLHLPTWVLLSPNSLLPAKEVSTLLGALVQDFEHPLDQFIPEKADVLSAILHQCGEPIVVHDDDFQSTIDTLKSNSLKSTVGDVFEASVSRSQGDGERRTSSHIITYSLRQHKSIFQEVKKKFQSPIFSMINETPGRNKGAIYMVVGMKVAVDTQAESSVERIRTVTVETGLPVSEIVLAATGVPLPVNVDIGVGGSKENRLKVQSTVQATGHRIFAIQYRLVRKHKHWYDFTMPEPELRLDDYHTVREGKGLFSGDAASSDEIEDEDVEDSDSEREVEDDELELGDLAFTASLGPEITVVEF